MQQIVTYIVFLMFGLQQYKRVQIKKLKLKNAISSAS